MRKEILRAEHICKSINGSPVLKSLSLSVYEREILGMTGLSGAGKSVIAEILSGIRYADSGRVIVSGKPMEMGSVERAAECGIYHIAPEPVLFPCLSVEENICLTEVNRQASFHFPAKQQLRALREVMKSLGISLDGKTSVEDLSLCEKHRIAILRAYYLHAKLIVIDNISNEYTEEEFRKLGQLLLTLKQRGVSILFIESVLERVVAFTDRLLILRNGRDEGLLFRDEYGLSQIRKIMMGDYGIPQTVEKTVRECNKEILLSAEQVESRKLHDFSVQIKKGEVIGFLDQEKIMSEDILKFFRGEAELTGGRVLLSGNPIPAGAGRAAMIKAGFGYVDYYKNSIFPKLSLKDNLTITSLNRLTSRTMINLKLEKMVVLDLLKRLNIPEENWRKPIKDVSNRDQLAAALYKWILNRSRVVVLNNVLSGTDMIMHNIVVRFLNELREKEQGAVVFSPSIRELYELCDKIYVVREGKIEKTVSL